MQQGRETGRLLQVQAGADLGVTYEFSLRGTTKHYTPSMHLGLGVGFGP